MAEQLLDHPDVGAVVEHVGGAGVAQDVGRQSVAQPDRLAVPAHDPPGALPGQAPAPGVEEDGLRVAPPAPPVRHELPPPPG